jgi:hypothetical protein
MKNKIIQGESQRDKRRMDVIPGTHDTPPQFPPGYPEKKKRRELKEWELLRGKRRPGSSK